MNRNSLLNVFTPKYYSLFPYFDNSAENLILAAEQLKLLMQTNDSIKQISISKQLIELEKIGNNVMYDIYTLLNRLLIVPFDREDIIKLINKVDKILHTITKISRMMHFYKLSELFPVYSELAEIIYLTSHEIGICFKHLRDVSDSKRQIIKACENLNQLAKKADEIFYFGVLSLFTPNGNMTHLMKKKEILETLKSCVGETNSVAESFRKILIKAA